MAKNKNKNPHQKNTVIVSKTPSGANKANDIPNILFKWKTDEADHDGDFGWNKVAMDKLFDDIIPKLQEFESMHWMEVENNRNHFISTDNISKEAKDRLASINREDEDTLFSLHLNGKERIWGIRENNVLKLLWWDPEHKVCPCTLKHT